MNADQKPEAVTDNEIPTGIIDFRTWTPVAWRHVITTRLLDTSALDDRSQRRITQAVAALKSEAVREATYRIVNYGHHAASRPSSPELRWLTCAHTAALALDELSDLHDDEHRALHS